MVEEKINFDNVIDEIKDVNSSINTTKDSLNVLKQYWYNILNIVNRFDFNPSVAAELTNKLQEVRKCIDIKSVNTDDYKSESVNVKAG